MAGERQAGYNSVPSQFSAADVEKGAEIQAKASIQGLDVLSNSVKILNAPPEISKVKIMPELFKPGDRLKIESAGSDVDGDRVAVQCEWTRNGEPAGNGESIEGALKRGDKISVKVTPYDGETYGSSIVLNREIRNMPPVIAEHKEFNFDGMVYACQDQGFRSRWGSPDVLLAISSRRYDDRFFNRTAEVDCSPRNLSAKRVWWLLSMMEMAEQPTTPLR